MEKDKKIEEALSVVWEEREKKVFDAKTVEEKIREKVGEGLIDELVREGYLRIENSVAAFTAKGETIAKDATRRQRLAERLLTDVLELGRQEMDSSACEFEHILSKEVEESICTLLGHPVECPHGLPIPRGGCCAKSKAQLESIVMPLSRLLPGEAGRVVYVITRAHPQLHKLMSFGIVPGVTISVHQNFPAVIIQAEETQIALEPDIAKEIYVKRVRKT